MQRKFLPYLQDPLTGEALDVEIFDADGENILEGALHSSTNSYPIIRGVPRFLRAGSRENYTKSFGYQWLRWPKVQFESENVGRSMEGHTSQMFQKITCFNYLELSNIICVDFGCGSGRFLELVSKGGGLVIGLDSSNAVESAGEIFKYDSNVLVCQADILRSPIKSNIADLCYSIGVLHHTPSFDQGVKEISRIVKPNGIVAVSVYGPGGYYDDFIVGLYRKFFKLTRPLVGFLLPLLYSYLVVIFTRPLIKFPRLAKALKPLLGYFPHAQLPDIRWSFLDTFDSLTPEYQQGLSFYQVHQSLQRAFIGEITPSNWKGTALTGRKVRNEPHNL